MTLTYRGVDYHPPTHPKTKFAPAFARGCYRGIPIRFRTLAEVPQQPRHPLAWRGIAYWSGEQPQKAPTGQKPTTVAEQARQIAYRHHQQTRRRAQAMLARADEEVGLTAHHAAEYEGEIQGKFPHDFAGYDRSYSAMS